LAATIESLHTVMYERVEALIAASRPALSRRRRVRTAQVCVQIIKAMLPMVLTAGPKERGTVVVELKRALVAYLSSDQT
jgi:hypothetical protein